MTVISFSSCSLLLNPDREAPEQTEGASDPTERLSFTHDLFNDMFLPHEGPLSGVPKSFGWSTMPAVERGNNIPEGWNAVLAYGQIYADANNRNPNQDYKNVRVHIKDLQLYILKKNGIWQLIQNDERPQGAAYVENFANDENKPADERNEADGGISVTAGSGYNFHFWPHGRNTVDGNNIKGVFVVFKARLIGTENYPSLPGNLYLAEAGGDYWRNMTAKWAPNEENNVGIGMGRFKYVTAEWQYFIMHTFTKDEVKNLVFPIEM